MRLNVTRAELDRMVKSAVLSAYAERIAPLPDAAVRSVSGLDPAWVRSQIATREAYIRSAAAAMGLDPDEALAADCAKRPWWTATR